MNYGGFWVRFLAYIVDWLIISIGFVAVVMLLGMMGLELISNELILFAMGVLYFAFMQASARQATYGKALLGLKVGGLAGERISLGRALAREVAKIISTLTFLIGYIIAGFTLRKQALHDYVASTTVVRAAPGQVVVALALALVALMAPLVVVFMFGAGLVAGMLGPIAGALMTAPEVVMQAPKPAAVPKPVPVAAAPAAPAAPAPPKPVATPVSAPPVVLAQAQPVPKPAAAEPPKPVPPPAVPAKPAEPVKPVAAEPPKEEEKPKPRVRKPRIKPDAPKETTAAPAPAPAVAAPMAEEPPKPMADEPPKPVLVPARPMAAPSPRYNDLATAVIFGDAATVLELLRYGKWADKPDSRGVTPLMLAAERGDAESAEALLAAGANPNRPGPGGTTATSIARERKDAAMMRLLQRYGGR